MFELRFYARGARESVVLHERADCDCGCGGGWTESAARRELSNVLARMRVGIRKREPSRQPATSMRSSASTTFHEYASQWLQRRTDGVLGDRPLSENARNDYLWRLGRHLLPYFGRHRLEDIDAEMCLAFKAHKMKEPRDPRAAIAAAPTCATIETDAASRSDPRRCESSSPASSRSSTMPLRTSSSQAIPLGDDACVSVFPKPQRSFLEIDELQALMAAAASQDPTTGRVKARPGSGEAARKVADMLSRGISQDAIAAALGRSKATINWHARRMSVVGVPYRGRAFVVRVLAYSGVRNSELCDMRIGHVRLHDPAGARFHIPDARTETGVRVVEMSPDLVEAFVQHPTGSAAPASRLAPRNT